MKTVFITGVTGVMGRATLDAVLQRGDCKVRALARDSGKNRKLLRKYLERNDFEVVWGDLLDYSSVERALGDATIVIHLGGMVSPMADRFPDKTLKVNTEGTGNVVAAVKKRTDCDEVKLIYIGSVAQISDRRVPNHWARTGDPVMASEFDFYGLSKILAERIVAESGLKHWVSLRQTGILHPGLFLRGSDPITFHVPLNGVLEWATAEDSGNLMAALCGDNVPETFWRNFYNIGSGKNYRLTNYEFEKMILGAVGSPSPEKIFEPNWFATRNFHGCWFADSDKLEALVPFRENIPAEEYFRKMVKKAPLWVRLAPLAPPFLVKRMMKKVAMTPDYGTLDWIKRNDCEEKINAFFGSREERDRIPGWKELDLSRPSEEPRFLDHGYDDTKADHEITVEDCRQAAAFRGGKCLSADDMSAAAGRDASRSASPNVSLLDTTLEWECGRGHRFKATPRLILRGGHWCEHCLPAPWRYREEAAFNSFISQLNES